MSSETHIDYQRFRGGETCGQEGCRARKFYIEAGKKYCQRGHEQAGFTQTGEDEDDFGNQGKKTRKKRVEEERTLTIATGIDAKELYLKCLQLIIWKQCYWLIKRKGLPPELETIVRDLWGLRLGIIWKDGQKTQSTFSSQAFSSQSEGETSATDATDGKSLTSRRSKRFEEKMPVLRETLGLCYLGMLLLRLPLSLGELWLWAMRDEVVFTRAIKEVPRDMRRSLPASYHSALELKAPLKGDSLHRIVGELIRFFNVNFEMKFPPLNSVLILYKHIQHLGLPVEIYAGVQRLVALLNITFHFPTTSAGIKQRTPSSPEAQLISLIVIATKLLHPFDDITRVPENDADPSSTRIDWGEWTRIMIQPPTRDMQRGEEMFTKDEDVWDMNGKQMDGYMDWYQRTWIDDRPAKFPEQILDMFPLPELPPQAEIDSDAEKREFRLKEVQHHLHVQKARPREPGDRKESFNRPGQLYKRYRTVEELPQLAKGFYGRCAETAGMSLMTLVKTVFRLEVQLENWRMDELRKTLYDEEDSEEYEDNGNDEVA